MLECFYIDLLPKNKISEQAEKDCRQGEIYYHSAERAENRALLMALDVNNFIGVMERWNRYFIDGADLPIIGATEQQLRSIEAPACVIPGNDNSHPRRVGENLVTLLPHAELHSVDLPDYDLDLSPRDEWNEREPALAKFFTGFMARVRANSAT